MAHKDDSLLNKCLKRAINFSGTPLTQQTLVDRCQRDIEFDGPQAHTLVLMRGERGLGLKKHRRLVPAGPLGDVRHASAGHLHIEFPSVGMLIALKGHTEAFLALSGYFTEKSEVPYPSQMTVELAAHFAQSNIGIEIDLDVIEALHQIVPAGPFGNGRWLIVHLLEIERIAAERRWKRVDLSRWCTAGLTWPVIRPGRRLLAGPRPVGTLHRVSERHAKLLRDFDKADEAGKLHIEQSATFAAAAVRVDFLPNSG